MNTYYAIQDATDTTEHLESTATTEVEWWQAAPKEGKPQGVPSFLHITKSKTDCTAIILYIDCEQGLLPLPHLAMCKNALPALLNCNMDVRAVLEPAAYATSRYQELLYGFSLFYFHTQGNCIQPTAHRATHLRQLS